MVLRGTVRGFHPSQVDGQSYTISGGKRNSSAKMQVQLANLSGSGGDGVNED